MKLFGSLTELVSAVFRKNSQAITLRPNQSVTYTASRDIQTPAQDADSVLVSRTSTDTLTNKTLTAPVISTISNTGTLTLPTSTDTLVGRATTDTLTNKTLTSATITNPNLTVQDGALAIQDNGDATKQLQFQCSGITTGTTRTLTVPDASGTIALLGTAQTFSADQTYSSKVRIADGTAADPSLVFTSDDDGSGTGLYRIGANNLGFTAAGTKSGAISSAAAWQLGQDGAGNTTGHNINGRVDFNSGAAATGASGYVLRVIKTDATTTADGNFFISFGVNTTLNNSGRIASNGANAAAFFSTSDSRLKQNVETLTGGLDAVCALRPVSFEWIEHPGTEVKGFLAQEVKDVVPEAVSSLADENAGYYSMCRENFIPYMVAAIKELKEELDDLRSEYEAYVAAHP